MFHKKGNTFHRKCDQRVSASEYREAISDALSQELGGAGRATKSTMRWTGASERTAKNWISGAYGPAGENLIALMKHSDTVFAVVLELAGRSEAISIARLKLVREELAGILSDLDTICADEGDQKPE